MDWNAVNDAIAAATGQPLTPGRAWPVGGGSINSAFRYDSGEQSFFVKLNRRERRDMFEAEAAGLQLLAQPGAPRVPQVLALGEAGGQAFLVLEYIPLRSARAERYTRLGEQLATLHRVQGERHGWERDNTIGTTPQPNTPSDDWVAFLRDSRLRYQLELSAEAGHPGLGDQAEPVLERLGDFFRDYVPAPSLLHGDLWSGNVAFDAAGEPVIFDPACYFGDRESDIAMTELFGGFTDSFYTAYKAAYPLDAGYTVRRGLYQLYHVLNHLNLFGGGYLARARQLIEQLKSELV